MADYIAKLGYTVDTTPLKRGERALNDVTKAGNKTETSVTRLNNSIGVLQAGIAAIAGSAVIGGLVRYSDAWNRIDNQLRVVIDSEDELIQKRQMLIQLSKDTNASLDSTVALYAELYRNTRQLGTSEEELSSVTKTLNNLFVAGGKDAATQAGAIRQLSQALGSGALRGDEFISVSEAAPRVLDALSQSLNMAKGELRDFAATGGITAEILINALTKYDSQAQKMADATTKTFEQYMQNAETNLLTFVSQSEAMLSVTDAIGSGIEYISENLDALSAAFKAGAVVIGASMIPAVVKYTASIWASVTAQLAATPAVTAYNATLMKTVVITEATTRATNMLTLATRVLLGPWGLLATALGAAAIAFGISKSASEDAKDELAKHNKIVGDLKTSYGELSNEILATKWSEAVIGLNELESKMASLKAEMAKPNADSGIGFNNKAFNQLKEVTAEYEKQKTLVDTIADIFEQRNNAANKKAAQDTAKVNKEYQKQIDALKQLQQEFGMTSDELFLFREQQKSIARGDTAEATAEITRQAQAYLNLGKAQTEFQAMVSGQDQVDTYALQQAKDYDTWIESIYRATGAQQQLQEEIEKTQKAMDAGDLSQAAGNEYIKTLQDQIDGLNGTNVTVFDSISSSAKDGLSSIQSLYAQGSKEYQKLGIAIQAVSAAQAVFAVLNQASGDPYTALGRMAAMVGAVGALGFSVANIGSGFSDESASAQANQGLTVWGDKSESIANAIDITSDATSKLVGINTNMLDALNRMAQGLAGASALIARDTDTSSLGGVSINESFWGNFGALGSIASSTSDWMSKLGGDFLGITGFIFDGIGKLLGGSSKTTNSGIQIIGDSINDMINDITVEAFQSIKYKKWAFGGSKRKTITEDISDTVGTQFSLVLESMVDAVSEAASALGISSGTTNNRIRNFRIATQQISLKGLSAEEQQAEIEAVFSKIFDDLASTVVPFADRFQEVGEGMGETLVRLATQMQVTEKASEMLGFSFGNASAYMNTFASDALSNLVGGVSNLASLTSSFVDNFATDEQKLAINSQALNDALSGVGLAVPATADGFYSLMSTLNANTKAGREQIATLLNIQDVAKEYYDLLEDSSSAIDNAANELAATNSQFNALTENLRNMVISMYDLGDASSQVGLDMALAAARAGDFSLAQDFRGVSISAGDFSSRADYQIAQAQAANKIVELADLTESQVSVEERQLNKLDEINNSLAKQKEDLETMRYANETMAKNNASSLKLLQQMVGYGINVTVVS